MSRKKVAVVVLPLVPVMIIRQGGKCCAKAFKNVGCHLKANFPGRLVAEPLPLKRMAQLKALTSKLATWSLSVHGDVEMREGSFGVMRLFYTEMVENGYTIEGSAKVQVG
jgi:hypothetical protein